MVHHGLKKKRREGHPVIPSVRGLKKKPPGTGKKENHRSQRAMASRTFHSYVYIYIYTYFTYIYIYCIYILFVCIFFYICI